MTQQQLKNISRDQAEAILFRKFGIRHFYDEQWNIISRLLKGDKALIIERTGFGKSLCYQFPALLFSGVTIVFSPLIALMRDQQSALHRAGISARCVNSSQTTEENEEAIEAAVAGKVKILYVTPERQNNEAWNEAVRMRMKISMIVVDEAHTISTWGHDFRPAFRRIVNLVSLFPKTPILAATATATNQVQDDIMKQLGMLNIIRGDLRRDNLILSVVKVKSRDEKLAWLASNLPRIAGTGIIYAGTHASAEVCSEWLKYNNIKAISYHAGLDNETRKSIETGFMNNKWKCVVSTNALGMGIDKSDIRFIIHLQAPQSPIHYYQEIGRAGRDGAEAKVVLLYNDTPDENGLPADDTLPLHFINNSKPKTEDYNRIIDLTKEDLYGELQLMKITNFKQTKLRVIISDLIEQRIISEVKVKGSKKYKRMLNAPKFNGSIYEELRKTKINDYEAMKRYINTQEPRMKFLCDYLNDYHNANDFTNCDNSGRASLSLPSTDKYKPLLNGFWENYFPVLRFDIKSYNLMNGVAASYYGDTEVGNAIHNSKYVSHSDFPDFLVKRTLKAIYSMVKKQELKIKEIDFVMFIPPTISGGLVENFANRIALALHLPLSHDLIKVKKTRPAKEMTNSVLQRENVKDAFEVKSRHDGQIILLVDDICDSGNTLKEAAKMITKSGADKIFPVTIAKTLDSTQN